MRHNGQRLYVGRHSSRACQSCLQDSATSVHLLYLVLVERHFVHVEFWFPCHPGRDFVSEAPYSGPKKYVDT